MAASRRRAKPAVEHELFEHSYRFEFFQAVRMLERLYRHRKPVGHDADPSDEVVRFRSHISLDFPASAVQEIQRSDDRQGQPEMAVNFMGLAGPLGVLPRHYTELVLERMREKDTGLRDFLDILNHRFVSLFYRAWEKHRFEIPYERFLTRLDGGQGEEDTEEDSDEDADELYEGFSQYLFDLCGLSTPLLRKQLDVPSSSLLFYSGLLSQQPRSASALEGFLEEYFEASVEVVQFVGQWLPLIEQDRTRLGEANATLGDSAIVGDRVWDQPAKFRLRFGPLSFDRFCSFLPSGSAFPSLVRLTRIFAGQEKDFDVQLVLKASEVPACKLGEGGEAGPRLGWSSWLKSDEFTEDNEAVILRGGDLLVGAFPNA